MTVIVTRNVEDRVRGFLASCMLEISSGVYSSPNMNPAVRERVWAVLVKWNVGQRGDSAIMTWPEKASAGGQEVRRLGEPPIELCSTPSVTLSKRPLTDAERRSLTTDSNVPF